MTALLEIHGLIKAYGGLRPLRLRELIVGPGDVLIVDGVDQPAAETLVHLITGASLPDEGEVRLFGRSTRDITDVQAWLQSLDALGVFSPRTVLVNPLTVRQNLAIPFTLDLDPVPLEIWPRVDALARLVGIDESVWDVPAGGVGAAVQARARLGRALALQPSLIVAEHPSLGLPREAVGAVAADLGSIARARGFAVLALTADRAFAETLVGRRFSFNAASGELTAAGGLLDKVSRLFR